MITVIGRVKAVLAARLPRLKPTTKTKGSAIDQRGHSIDTDTRTLKSPFPYNK